MLSDAIATVTGAICGTSTAYNLRRILCRCCRRCKNRSCGIYNRGVILRCNVFKPGCSTDSDLCDISSTDLCRRIDDGGVADIEWHKPEVAVPSFMTIAMMPFAYNISYGIAFGLITYVFICIFTGRVKEIKPFTWVVGALFAIMFFMTH